MRNPLTYSLKLFKTPAFAHVGHSHCCTDIGRWTRGHRPMNARPTADSHTAHGRGAHDRRPWAVRPTVGGRYCCIAIAGLYSIQSRGISIACHGLKAAHGSHAPPACALPKRQRTVDWRHCTFSGCPPPWWPCRCARGCRHRRQQDGLPCGHRGCSIRARYQQRQHRHPGYECP